MENQIVSLNKVEKRFGKFQALKDVTFDVNKGEVLGFIFDGHDALPILCPSKIDPDFVRYAEKVWRRSNDFW